MTIKSVATFIGAVLVTSTPIGFGVNRFSKERFEINAKKLELITPYYDQLQEEMNKSLKTFSWAKNNLLEAIDTIPNSSIYDTNTVLNHLERGPFATTMLDFEVSRHLPKQCQKLVKELMPVLENGVGLVNEVTDHYSTHTYFQDVFQRQAESLNAANDLIKGSIKSIERFIDDDKLRLTRSVRRRTWYSK